MRVVIAALILLAIASFAGAFWMAFNGKGPHFEEAPVEAEAQPKPEPKAADASPAAPSPAAPAPAAPAPATPAPAAPAPAAPAASASAPAPSAPTTSVPASSAPPPPSADPLAALAVRPPPLPLALPVACTPGADCWVINHVDLDPGPGRRDYRCGAMSYDGHKGTDIALRNLARLADDVAVLAAAPGKVVGTRDGVEDVSIAVGGREAVKDRECGNGVRLQHDGGWATQYCHLKRGSIAVQTGQAVAAGQRLGAVGLSGMTEFPHVHVQVEKDGKIVDPFRGLDGGPECGRGTVPLWNAEARRALVDPAPILIDAGFSTGPVEKADAEAGRAAVDAAAADAGALVIWSRIAGLEPGDVLTTTIAGPDGAELFDNRWTADKVRIMWFQYSGKKRPAGGWKAGTYTGRVVLERPGRTPRERRLTIRIGG
ncbi:MAG: M23 family metallopeptidase [Thalassobaculum sp.]|uniref:M23 family metallopeptidase n=1 Tax=Thalassobaculum sp. TaxID=2022740 RepID=UPI0032ECB69D